jgi:hypothetical protein
LIAVDIRIVHYLELNKPQAVVLFEVAKGMITGKQPEFPPVQTIEKK